MTWNRHNPTLTRRQQEALAAFASGPPGETIAAFCRRSGLSRDTWYEWRATPAFAAAMARVETERLAISLEPLHAELPRLTQVLIDRAASGSLPALRIVGEWLSLARRGRQSVQVEVDTRVQLGSPSVEDDEGIEKLLHEHKRNTEIMYEYAPLDALRLMRDYHAAECERLAVVIAQREAVSPAPVDAELGSPQESSHESEP